MKILYDENFTFGFGKDCEVIIKADNKTDAVNKLLELGRLIGTTSSFFLENSIVDQKSNIESKEE